MALTPYTASHAISVLKIKGKVSNATSLIDQDILTLLNDSYAQYIVGFTQSLRDEWWVGVKAVYVTSDSNSTILMPPGSSGSSLRTIAWNQGGSLIIPLPRIEPENAFPYLSQGPTGSPLGFMLTGNQITLLPPCPGIQVRLTYMYTPPEMVLEEDAAKVSVIASNVLTLASVPLEWQAATPTSVNIISALDPYTVIGVAAVTSLSGSTLTLTANPNTLSHWSELSANGIWVADVGMSPFPQLPVCLQPLLQQHCLETIMEASGDPRLAGISKRKEQMASELKSSMEPRVQGTSRPLVNKMKAGFGGYSGANVWSRGTK